ncbi:MAG TPA: ASPIC/UnbV domain-containing protein, partial [Acidobacteriota bacterium]
EVSRGLAIGDLDNDGDSDAILCNNSGPARVLLNVHQNNHHWLGLRLLGRQGRDAYGALVTVAREGAPPLRRRVQADGSYLSSSDPRVLVGLASQDRVPWVRVDWPDGDTETWRGLQIDRYQTLRQGEGERP